MFWSEKLGPSVLGSKMDLTSKYWDDLDITLKVNPKVTSSFIFSLIAWSFTAIQQSFGSFPYEGHFRCHISGVDRTCLWNKVLKFKYKITSDNQGKIRYLYVPFSCKMCSWRVSLLFWYLFERDLGILERFIY